MPRFRRHGLGSGEQAGYNDNGRTMEYKKYRIETEERNGEWFATIGRLDGLEVWGRAGRHRLYRTKTGTLTKDEALDLARDPIDGRSVV